MGTPPLGQLPGRNPPPPASVIQVNGLDDPIPTCFVAKLTIFEEVR
jgi:hypothetical protein